MGYLSYVWDICLVYGIFVVCPPPCCKHCWRVVPRCSCSCSNSLFFSGSPSGKPGFSFRKPLPTGDSKISKCLKCAPVQAGTLPRGAKVAETHAIDYPPPLGYHPPRDPPKSSLFRPAFSQGSRNSLGSLAGPLESHLESPWRP